MNFMNESLAYVIAVPSVFLLMVMLYVILTRISEPDTDISDIRQLLHVVRRHGPSGGFWQVPPEELTRPEGYLAPSRPRHRRDPHDSEWDAVIHDPNADRYVPTGRRSAENPFRTIVPSDWRPVIGELRIDMLETPTSEILVMRRKKLGPPPGYRQLVIPRNVRVAARV